MEKKKKGRRRRRRRRKKKKPSLRYGSLDFCMESNIEYGLLGVCMNFHAIGWLVVCPQT